ncbi:hypothetical protein NL529_27685, partial [Klebsiella pneumoniae]|nr:hypothetical protein [Klebsiella pneumoniae]
KHLNADALSRKTTTENCLAITEQETTFEMIAEQLKDGFFSQIKNWVRADQRPTMEQISTFDYEEKLLWARFDELSVIKEMLCLSETTGAEVI